jgi:hypothetical protein
MVWYFSWYSRYSQFVLEKAEHAPRRVFLVKVEWVECPGERS